MQQYHHSFFDFVVLLLSPEQCPPQPCEDGNDQSKELLNPVFQDKVDQWNHLLSHRIHLYTRPASALLAFTVCDVEVPSVISLVC